MVPSTLGCTDGEHCVPEKQLSISAYVSVEFAGNSNFMNWKHDVDRDLNDFRLRILELERSNSRSSLHDQSSSSNDSGESSTDWINAREPCGHSDSSSDTYRDHGSIDLVFNESLTEVADIQTENISGKTDSYDRLAKDTEQQVDCNCCSKADLKIKDVLKGGATHVFKKERLNCTFRGSELGMTYGETNVCAPSKICSSLGKLRCNSKKSSSDTSGNGEVCDASPGGSYMSSAQQYREGFHEVHQQSLDCTNVASDTAIWQKQVSLKHRGRITQNLVSRRKQKEYINKNGKSINGKCNRPFNTVSEVSRGVREDDSSIAKRKSPGNVIKEDLMAVRYDDRRRSLRSLLLLTLYPNHSRKNSSESIISKPSLFTKSDNYAFNCVKPVLCSQEFL